MVVVALLHFCTRHHDNTTFLPFMEGCAYIIPKVCSCRINTRCLFFLSTYTSFFSTLESLSTNMIITSCKLIGYLFGGSLSNKSPIKRYLMQHFIRHSLVNKAFIIPIMARPYEIINMTTDDVYMDTKQSNNSFG